MDEELIELAESYAGKHEMVVGEFLGSGIHGRVCLLLRKGKPVSALKSFRSEVFYERERGAYFRLRERGIRTMRGFAVPQLIRWDDALLAIEMTLVSPPRMLDFASACVDWPPEFSDEVWADWERKNQEEFGDDWPMVQVLLSDLEDMGIHMLDPSPSNIRFR